MEQVLAPIPRQSHRPVQKNRSQHKQTNVCDYGTSIAEKDSGDCRQQGEDKRCGLPVRFIARQAPIIVAIVHPWKEQVIC